MNKYTAFVMTITIISIVVLYAIYITESGWWVLLLLLMDFSVGDNSGGDIP